MCLLVFCFERCDNLIEVTKYLISVVTNDSPHDELSLTELLTKELIHLVIDFPFFRTMTNVITNEAKDSCNYSQSLCRTFTHVITSKAFEVN